MKNFKMPTKARKIYLNNGDVIENCKFYILGDFIVIDTTNEIYNVGTIMKIELKEGVSEDTSKELIKQLEG